MFISHNIKKYKEESGLDSIIFIPNFMKISHLIKKLNGRQHCDLVSLKKGKKAKK
jgi:hypothetical protein